MDVKCERCNTEYEFDDALVSGRGTTVKCTNCGHKFKIHRSDGDFSEDFWNVITGDGRTLVFTSLRELQRAIQGYLVERNDRLSRGGLPPKAIGQIPELAPFFEQREAAKRSQHSGRGAKTHDGLGPAAQQAGATRPRQATMPEFLSAPENHSAPSKGTLIGGASVASVNVVPASEDAPAPSTHRQPGAPAAPAAPVPAASAPAASAPAASAPAAAAPAAPAPTAPAPTASSPTASPAFAAPPSVPVAPAPARENMNTVPLQRPALPPGASATPDASVPPDDSVPPDASVPPRAASNPPRSDRVVGLSDSFREPAAHQGAPAPASSSPMAAHRSLAPSARHTPSSPAVQVSSPLPPSRAHRSLLAEVEEDRDRVRGPFASLPDDLPPRRRSVGGFVVAAVVVGCALMLGAVWAQKNLGATLGTRPPAPPAPLVDPRVASFLTTGETALNDGNFELAKESFDKATALSENNSQGRLGLARLAAARADVSWLKSRLLPADAGDEHRITRDNLDDLAARARKAADDALVVAPEDPAALRAKIDALRISGDRDGARALVGKITPSGTQPETAYVLAALDLAEAEPLWPTVLERLKVASSAEPGPGRARAALVFALSRSGDGAGAKAEVERLDAMPKAHPLLPLLRAFADRAKAAAAQLDGGADPLRASAPDAVDAGRTVVGHVKGGRAGGLASDPRELVTQGERARARGDYARARTLYGAAIDKNPNDSEALAGLAAIAYAQHDLNGARASYKRVLATNPNYMPALVGLADVEWDSGDKGTASKMYKDIIDRYPEGAYPGRVKQRVEGG